MTHAITAGGFGPLGPLAPLTPDARPAPLPRALKIALGASLALHLGALLVQHGAFTPAETLPKPLQVMLRANPQPAPTPAPIPAAPLAAAPVRSQPARTAPAEPLRPAAILTRPVAAATPTVKAEATVAAPAPVTPAAVAVTDPAPHAPAPAATPAAPVPPAAPVISHVEEAPDPALLERYGRSLSSALARQQNYPRLAALRGWEGEVQLRVTIARKGNIVATQVLRSSGFEVLDKNAVQLVTNAGTLPRPPESLQNRDIQIIVPVLYKLDKPS